MSSNYLVNVNNGSSCDIFKTCGGYAFNDFISGFDNRRK